MATSDDDRIAYLTGEDPAALPSEERAPLDELRAILHDSATWEEPGPALEEGVVAAIAAEAERRQPDRPRTRQPRTRSAGRDSRWWRPRLAMGAVAAAAVVAVALLISQTGGPSKRPLQFAMVVSGTPLAPDAHGSATLTKTASGWRVELAASGLPHLENGLFYQAWLKNAAGVLVPIGTFNDARHVTLWSGVPVTKFRTLTVTRQRADGNPASSGMRVLLGTIAASR